MKVSKYFFSAFLTFLEETMLLRVYVASATTALNQNDGRFCPIFRALELVMAGGGGVLQAGRGRGRGATLPAWLSHPEGIPGGLQQNGGGGRRYDSLYRRLSFQKCFELVTQMWPLPT